MKIYNALTFFQFVVIATMYIHGVFSGKSECILIELIIPTFSFHIKRTLPSYDFIIYFKMENFVQPKMADTVVHQTMLSTVHVLLVQGTMLLRLASKYQNAKVDVQMMLIVKAILF